MNRNWLKMLICSFCCLVALPSWASDYSVDYSMIDLMGGAQTGGTYSGQSICTEESSNILTSADYALHPFLSESNLVVTSGLTLIEYGSGPLSFGSFLLGSTPVAMTFNVFNNGSMGLALGSPNCPSGYSVTDSLAPILPPGAGDNFTVVLATSALGIPNGLVTFSNSDLDFQCFEFYISGLIGMADLIWADFDWSGTERGNEPQLFSTLAKSVNAVNSGGTVSMKAGTTSEHPRITKTMRLEAVGGTVRIGAGS